MAALGEPGFPGEPRAAALIFGLEVILVWPLILDFIGVMLVVGLKEPARKRQQPQPAASAVVRPVPTSARKVGANVKPVRYR